MRDRTLYGFYAGIIAGITQTIFNLISYYLNFAQIRYLDWMSVIIFGDMPIDSLQTITALFSRIIFSGILGIVFAYVIKHLNDEHYLFKGWIYAIVVMGILYGLTSLLQVPQLTYSHTYSVISNFLTSSIFGLVLTVSFKHLIQDNSMIQL